MPLYEKERGISDMETSSEAMPVMQARGDDSWNQRGAEEREKRAQRRYGRNTISEMDD